MGDVEGEYNEQEDLEGADDVEGYYQHEEGE